MPLSILLCCFWRMILLTASQERRHKNHRSHSFSLQSSTTMVDKNDRQINRKCHYCLIATYGNNFRKVILEEAFPPVSIPVFIFLYHLLSYHHIRYYIYVLTYWRILLLILPIVNILTSSIFNALSIVVVSWRR